MGIRLSEEDVVFAKGLASGTKAREQLDEVAPDAPYGKRFGLFWLAVGAAMAQELHEPTTVMREVFLRGAWMRAPEAALVLTVDRADSLAFDPQAETDETARYEMALILYRTARAIEHDGMDEGTLVDSNSTRVGMFKLNLA